MKKAKLGAMILAGGIMAASLTGCGKSSKDYGFPEISPEITSRCDDAGESVETHAKHKTEIEQTYNTVYKSEIAREEGLGNGTFWIYSKGAINASKKALGAAQRKLDHIHPVEIEAK